MVPTLSKDSLYCFLIFYNIARYKKTSPFRFTSAWEKATVILEKAMTWPEHLGVGRPCDPDLRLPLFLKAVVLRKLGEHTDADNLIEEIKAYTRTHEHRWGPGHVAGIFAMQLSGETSKARSMITNWVEHEPNRLMALWAQASFEGDIALRDALEARILQENPDNLAYEFALIECYRMLRTL